MSKEINVIHEIKLANTKNGIIVISKVNEPYGAQSTPVVSIGISLKGVAEELDWKAHIPYENLEDVIKALENIKKDFS